MEQVSKVTATVRTHQRHEALFFADGNVAICFCGFNPWEELSTDNSGPNTEDVIKLINQHLEGWAQHD